MVEYQIWIVEDESIVAIDLKGRLQAMGYRVPGISNNAEDAIEEIRTHRPDLVLMDIVLKGEMDGIAAAAIIKEEMDIPVVYLTAYSEDSTVSRAKLTEPFGYILKPFMERDLRIAIEIALYKSSMEKRLRESERWLKTTIRSMGEGIIATDTGGLIRFMNPVAIDLTGVGEEQVIGRPSRTAFQIEIGSTGEDAPDPVMRALIDQEAVRSNSHVVLISLDGTRRNIEYTATPILDEKGRFTGAVLIFRDITDRIRIEEELRCHREHLEELVAERTNELRKVNTRLEQTLHYIDMAEKKWVEEALVSEVTGGYSTKPVLPEGLISIDSGCTVLLINYAAEEITGWTQKEASDHHLSSVLVLEDLMGSSIDCPFDTLFGNAPELPFKKDCILISRDGCRLPVLIGIEPFRDHCGEVTGATVSIKRK